MIDWNTIIWFVIWAVVIFAAVGLLLWVIVASIGLAGFRRAEKDFRKDFQKGFDSDFFKRHR